MATPKPMSEQKLIVYCATSTTCESASTRAMPPSDGEPADADRQRRRRDRAEHEQQHEQRERDAR